MGQTITDAGADVAHLDDLGRLLTGRGYLTMIVTNGGRPRLEVLNRTDPERYGSVICAAGAHGERWFWWTWADRVAPVDALERAADLVDRQLRTGGEAA